MTGRILIAVGLMAVTYGWLAFSMNVLYSPMAAMLVYYPVFCVGGGTVLRLLMKRGKDREGVQPVPRRKSVEVTIIWALVATAGLWAANLLIQPGVIDPEAIARGLRGCGMYWDNYWATAWMIVVVNPFAEEYLWRLGLFPFVREFRTEKEAIVISSIVFAGYHPMVVARFFPALWLIGVFLVVYAGGVMITHLFLKTRNIVYPMVFHLVANLNLMLMGYLCAPMR
jgi:membrane protease YdiL (CAAX protease family)